MKSLNYLFIASLLCMPIITHAMQQQDNNGTRIIYTDGRGLQDAPRIAHSFVHEALKDIGLNRPDLAIKVVPKNGDSSGWTAGHEMTIPDCEVDLKNSKSLINLLQKQNHTPEELEKINLCKGIIQHEGTHLKNNDHRNMGIAQWATFGLMTSALVYGWLHKGPYETNTQAAMKRLAFIPATITALAANGSIHAVYSRYVEQRADNGIADNINVLQAHANSFRKKAEEGRMEFDGKGGFREKSKWQKIGDGLLDALTRSHPSNKQRAERFEQRIAKLKEQRAQK